MVTIVTQRYYGRTSTAKKFYINLIAMLSLLESSLLPNHEPFIQGIELFNNPAIFQLIHAKH